MVYNMKLNQGPFTKIKNGSKTIELRLNDEKRRLLNIGDTIIFTNTETGETLETEVLGLYKYPSFEELYKKFNKVELGYEEYEKARYTDMEEYYTKQDIDKYGVVGIRLEVCKEQIKTPFIK